MASEAEMMQENMNEYETQYEQARYTLEDHYGVSMDASEWEIFWRAFGDSDVVSSFGSDTIVFIGEEVRNDPNLTMRQAARIAAETLKSGGYASEDQLRLQFNENVNRYKDLRYREHGPRLSDSDAMDMIF